MPFTLIGQLLRDFIFGSFMCKIIPYFQGEHKLLDCTPTRFHIVQLLFRELPLKVDSTYLLGENIQSFWILDFTDNGRTYEEFFIGYIKRERGIVLVIQSLILAYCIIATFLFYKDYALKKKTLVTKVIMQRKILKVAETVSLIDNVILASRTYGPNYLS